jgi:ATP-binding cassette, subfamily C, bacterial CydD
MQAKTADPMLLGSKLYLNRQTLDLTAGVRGQLAGLVALGLTITATYVGQAILIAALVADIFAGGQFANSFWLLPFIIGLIFLRGGLLWLKEIAARRIAESVKRNLRRRIYNKLLELGPSYLARIRTGEIQPLLIDQVETLDRYTGYYLPQLAVTTLGCFSIGLYLMWLDWAVGLVVFAAMPIVMTANGWWRRALGERGVANWQAYTGVKSDFLDSMQGMTTLKAFGASKTQGEKLETKTMGLFHATMSQMAVSLAGTGVMSLGIGVGTALAVIIGAIHLAEGSLSRTALLIVLFLSGEAFRPMSDLRRYWHSAFGAVAAVANIYHFLDTPVEIRDKGKTHEVINTAPPITFENVTFAYSPRRTALRNFSLDINAGETVALVGPSGAGKTTCASLLLRFIDPTSGQIKIAGHDSREYDLGALRQSIALVSQDTYLFYGTVADNLRLGKPDASLAELENAARQAAAHDFITALPQGYETIIGERGVRLSGGERQRIAIARALLKDAPILILDEATSSLDRANEVLIQDAFSRLTRGRTTIIIAHRLTTVAIADRIFVLDAGRVVETGNFKTLLDQPGVFSRLATAQEVFAS